MFITHNNQILSFGHNDQGQSGLGHKNQIIKPEILANFDEKIITLSKGFAHTLFLTSEGNVFSCGCNKFGQLGLGHNDSVDFPIKINISRIVIISCGAFNSFCIDENYDIYVFGFNLHGQLGVGHNNNINVPTKLHDKIKKIFPGRTHTYFRKINNNLYVCGEPYYHYNSIVQFEQLNLDYVIKDIKFGIWHTLFLTDDGIVYFKGYYCSSIGGGTLLHSEIPKKMIISDKIIAISCGSNHDLLLGISGDVYAFGTNDHGQLGVGDNKNEIVTPVKIQGLTNIVDIFCLENASFVFDGSNVSCFGDNLWQRLGLQYNGIIKTPIVNTNLKNVAYLNNPDIQKFKKTKSARNY